MPRTPFSSKATSPLLKLDWSTPSKSCETSPSMTNELLHNNLPLIRMAVDKAIACAEGYCCVDDHAYKDLLEFQLELEKQKTTGDSS